MYAIVIYRVRVHGPLYERIERRKDVMNDIAPPGYNVIESYLVVQQIVDAKDPVKRSKFVDRFRELRNQYQERHNHWLEELTDPQLRRMTTVDALSGGDGFLSRSRRATDSRPGGECGGRRDHGPHRQELCGASRARSSGPPSAPKN